jgi:hypothetical protein
MSLNFGALKEEMERRKREKEALMKAAADAAPAAAVGAGGKKYLRRGDIEALKSGAAAAGAPSASTSAPAGPHAAAAAAPASTPSSSSSSSASSAPASVSAHAATLQLPRVDVLRRLRRHGQVATYFGETDAARAERLYAYEAAHSLQAAEREDTGVKGGFEIGNTGRRTSAGRAHAGYDAGEAAEDEEDDDEEEAKRAAKRARTSGDTDASAAGGAAAAAAADGGAPDGAAAADDGGGGGDDDDGGGSVGSAGSKERGAGASSSSSSRHASKPRTTSADAAAHAGPGGDKYKYVLRYFKGLMHEWEDELAGRSESDKTSSAGLAATRLLKQCKDFVRPLFTALKARSVPADILSLTAEIVDHCRAR